MSVRGFGGGPTVALYRNRLGYSASGGYSRGGPRGRLTPADFADAPLQAQLVEAFTAALGRDSGVIVAPESAA